MALRKVIQDNLKACIEAWTKELPEGRVLNADDRAYHENCLASKRYIVAVLRPHNESEVITLVKIANTHRVPLYAFSIGNNWGYGSKLPVTDGCALVDLSLMNRILAFDADLGLVTLEPGVTQRQLLEYLVANHHDFYVPTTGAGPGGSIVGNALERGFGITPHEDHFQAVTSLRAVLADGRIYQSAFAEAGATTAGVWRWGVGPYLDGLFAQGNMGIVTSMQIALVDRAQHLEIFAIRPKKGQSIEDIMQAGKTLLTKMRGSLQGIKILNEFQIKSTLGVPLADIPPESANQWIGIGVYRCQKSMARLMRREINRALNPVAGVLYMNAWRHRTLEKLSGLLPGKLGAMIKQQLHSVKYILDVADGITRSDALNLVYAYEKPSTMPPTNPIKDGVGLIWYAPVLPMKPQLISRMVAMIAATLNKHGMPPLISLTTVNEKCAIGVIPIIYRRTEDVVKAQACYHDLLKAGNTMGCPPYRVNVDAMQSLTGAPGSVHWETVAKIKNALDPNHILSPGRYSPIPRGQ